MTRPRKKLVLNITQLILHEAGYKCANPNCRTILTLDIHHIVGVAENGSDTPDNLLALCPTCHALFHKGIISPVSIRTWKMLLLALNEAYDRRSIDLLLALEKTGPLWVSGDGVLQCAALVAAGLVDARQMGSPTPAGFGIEPICYISLSNRGRLFLEAWKQGNQQDAIAALNSQDLSSSSQALEANAS